MSNTKNEDFHNQLQHKIDHKTKPLGALGKLEDIANQVATIQGTLYPELKNPHIIVFAADHGIAKEGVSAYPQEVTYQMVYNFLNGGAAINVFANQYDIQLKVVDAGVNHDFPSSSSLITAKVAPGTQSYLHEPAMSQEQLNTALTNGHRIIKEKVAPDCNIIGFGEMGIGNSSSAALIMSYLCELPIEDCVGKGTGVNVDQFARKLTLLKQTQNFHGPLKDPLEILRKVGGFEIAQMCAAFLSAYERNILLLVDGFIATSAFLVAYKTNPDIINHAVFCHQSDEAGHAKMLKYLNVEALLQLNMRLGEGTGAAVAYPIIQSAVNFLNQMASFDSAEVSNKDT